MRPNVKLKSFRGDNGVYKSAEFGAELRDNDQHITYYGVCTHQNIVLLNDTSEQWLRKQEQFYSMYMQDGHLPSQ